MDNRIENICEYWQDLSHRKKLNKLLNDGYLADCKFVVGRNKTESEIIFGHKLMLMFESPVFEKHFNGNFSEGKTTMPEVFIEEFHPTDFRNFCLLIYCHNTVYYEDILEIFSITEIIEIYRLCHKYMVTSIRNKCLNYIISIINSIPVAEIILLYELANELDEKLLLVPVEKQIIIKKGIFCKELNELSPNIFYNYIVLLNTFEQKPSEVKIFKTIYSYFLYNNLLDKETEMEKTLLKNKEEKKEEKEDDNNTDNFYCIKKFLKLVDFYKMTAEEFVLGPGRLDLLNFKVKYDILSNLVMESKKAELSTTNSTKYY